jgi:Lipid A 3-O-deacylase (PagL)
MNPVTDSWHSFGPPADVSSAKAAKIGVRGWVLALASFLALSASSFCQVVPPNPWAAGLAPAGSGVRSGSGIDSSSPLEPLPPVPQSSAGFGPRPFTLSEMPAMGSANAGISAVSAASSAGQQESLDPKDCPYDETRARECRVHWRQLLFSSAVFITFENAGNLYTGYWYRYETTHGDWFDRWINSAADWKWSHWADGSPDLDDYVGHPMMGAITSNIWRQNDPKGMTVVQSNTWPYWRSILRATIFSTAYSFEWKLGPIGEASIGHNGDHPQDYQPNGSFTNGTGDVTLVMTPIGGTLWTLAEDALDKHVITRLEEKSRNPFALLGYQFLNPARATANILRFRPPWYRDTRVVKAATFWSFPDSDSSAPARDLAAPAGAETAISSHAIASALPEWPRPGGVHEFGAWWGLSLMTGHIWGYAKDVKYMPIDVRYSYLLSEHDHWAFRYSPELTALAMLDEPVAGQTDPELQRKRTYGSGISPVGFQLDSRPSHRVQPFLSTDGGFIYFMDRVLSPQGSRYMYTVDFGTGINVFRKERQAVTLGYRYQHLSNANISRHNPGTDANTFYVSVSRFRTKGYR